MLGQMKYHSIRLGGCREGGADDIVGGCVAEGDAEWFAIYGLFGDMGMAEHLVDLPECMTREVARKVLAAYGEAYGVPTTECKFLDGGA